MGQTIEYFFVSKDNKSNAEMLNLDSKGKKSCYEMGVKRKLFKDQQMLQNVQEKD